MIVIPVPAPVTGWTVVSVLCNRSSNLEVNPEDFPRQIARRFFMKGRYSRTGLLAESRSGMKLCPMSPAVGLACIYRRPSSYRGR